MKKFLLFLLITLRFVLLVCCFGSAILTFWYMIDLFYGPFSWLGVLKVIGLLTLLFISCYTGGYIMNETKAYDYWEDGDCLYTFVFSFVFDIVYQLTNKLIGRKDRKGEFSYK